MLRKVVLLGLAASAYAVPHFSQDDLNKQTGMARAAAHHEAMQSEAEIAKLVSCLREERERGEEMGGRDWIGCSMRENPSRTHALV
jgi:hypothetical protein